MNTMELNALPALFERVAERMDQESEHLCEMDARLGDGDLGLTMKKGFGAMTEILRGLQEPDLAKTLMKAGMKMSSVVPSTMGTLMSSGVMTGGKALAGKTELDAAGYLAFLRGFCDGIVKRGKCARGDRTVLDAIAPAADRVAEALEQNPGLTLAEAGEAAVQGARAGVEATRAMEPKYGKAAVHKAAAAGEPDQGACAGLYLLEGFRNYFAE